MLLVTQEQIKVLHSKIYLQQIVLKVSELKVYSIIGLLLLLMQKHVSRILMS